MADHNQWSIHPRDEHIPEMRPGLVAWVKHREEALKVRECCESFGIMLAQRNDGVHCIFPSLLHRPSSAAMNRVYTIFDLPPKISYFWGTLLRAIPAFRQQTIKVNMRQPRQPRPPRAVTQDGHVGLGVA
jgi:hypothetical protein